DLLVRDMAAVIDAVSPDEKVHLVGHDWGSIQAWEAVTTMPERFASFTSISGPGLDHAGLRMRAGPASADPNGLLRSMGRLAGSRYGRDLCRANVFQRLARPDGRRT